MLIWLVGVPISDHHPDRALFANLRGSVERGTVVGVHYQQAASSVGGSQTQVASGQIGYAVLSFGGFFGMDDKFFAVPWKALTLDGLGRRFV
jgi:hypothetical protein